MHHRATKTIKLQEEFRGAAKDVYNCMVDPNMLNAIMPGSTMAPSEGGAFSLLGGAITGENVKLVSTLTPVLRGLFLIDKLLLI